MRVQGGAQRSGPSLLPLVEDNGWFFDTELLVLAEHNGLRIHEVPVDWVDDPDSRVDIVSTARDDLLGVLRMLRRLAAGQGVLPRGALADESAEPSCLATQLVHFTRIGAISTVAFAALFALLAGPLGSFGADVVALGACAVANLAANRRITFSARGRAGRARQYRAGLTVALLPLGLTLVSLLGLTVAGVSSLLTDLVVLTLVNLAITLFRFLLLRRWVFRGAR